jgi:tetratricopeptide (TPR) repeat protein
VLDKNPVEDTPYRRARTLWSGGERGAALGVFDDEIAHDPTQPAPYVDMARLYLAAGDLDRARDYRDTARLLVHNDVDQARLFVLEAELALAEGDRALAGSRLDQASALLLPDDTGRPLYLYGRQIAHFQFLRITVRGKLLPQVVMLGPAPTLVDWLEEIYASWSGD